MGHRINLQDGTGVIATSPGYGQTIVFSTTAAPAAGIGYAEGCLYIYSAGSGSFLYINTGTSASATWTKVGTQS